MLTHSAGVLPDLSLTASADNNGILNIKWTFVKVTAGQRKPFEVPEDIVANIEAGDTPLEKYMKVTDKPFGIEV